MPGISQQYRSLGDFWKFFTQKLRLGKPWNFKAPVLIGVCYIIFLISSNKQNPFLPITAALLVIIGIAGVGYLSNDLGDRKKDKHVNKENVTANLGVTSLVLLFLVFVVLALAPWFYLPMDNLSFFLLGLQFLLFYAYALPPFRLKEKGFMGIVVDALYAHVNPAILAAHTFYLYTNKSAASFLMFVCLLGAWQFILGIRNILLHQIADHNNDLRSATKTFVTHTGVEKAGKLVEKILLPLELLVFTALAGFLSVYFLLFLPMVCCFWLIILFQKKGKSLALGYRQFAYSYLDDLYIKWLPLFVLMALIPYSSQFIYIAILHSTIFRNGLKDVLHFLRQKI